ncbi:MAG: type III toxin-antitoxin system ToxN/AbiQ family toxin, partial [Clostridia bacterium]|nr:type III toxin-antitoxin system ToxN/AbiQ family toxin [Clostridia bacterium]
MFTLDGNLRFINIDTDFIKALHDACDEVYYRPSGYENKPYLGLLVTHQGRKYAIPLTSAKPKHLAWRDVDNDRFLIYELADRRFLGARDIWKPASDP